MSEMISPLGNHDVSSVRSRSRRPFLNLALAAVLCAGGVAWAVNEAEKTSPAETKCDGQCPVAAKISTLLSSWKLVAAEVKSTSEAEQAKLKTELASLASECPVGSRMGETLGFAKAVLASTIKIESACTKQCPIDASGDKAASQVKHARAQILTGLDELAGYVSGVCSGTCAKEAGTESVGLAEKALVLLASWDKAPAELAALPAEKKQQLAVKAGAFAQRSKAMTLLPGTVEALNAGFNALDTLNGQLCDWVKSHPELCKDIPAEAKSGMASQMALLHATALIVDRAGAAMKACTTECSAAKTTTAASK